MKGKIMEDKKQFFVPKDKTDEQSPEPEQKESKFTPTEDFMRLFLELEPQYKEMLKKLAKL